MLVSSLLTPLRRPAARSLHLSPSGLDHVCVAVNSVARSVHWYTSILGLSLQHDDVPHFWPTDPLSPAFLGIPGCSGSGIALFGAGNLHREHRGAHFALRVTRSEFEQAQWGGLFDALEAERREGEDPSEVTFNNYGIQHSLFFSDPDRNVVELTHWPSK